MKYSAKDIDIFFTYHPASPDDLDRFEMIRERAKELGCCIIAKGGKEEDIEIALQKLRECVFFAIASIVVPKVGE